MQATTNKHTYIYFNVRQRGSILQLANCLEDDFVLLGAVAESNVEAPKVFDTTVKRLVAGSSTTLKLSYVCWIVCVRCIDNGVLHRQSLHRHLKHFHAG